VEFFPNFRREIVHTTGTTISALHGGDGPPLLLLHGFPQTHVEWRKIAPALAKSHTLVIPDLRGYGDSGKPSSGDDHAAYSKRSMALDQVEVMEKLGFKTFAVVGHDRGARVGHRLALDHPERLTKLVMIDICPTLYMYKTADRHVASSYFHWFFLIQPAPFPETLIANNLDAVLRHFMGKLVPEFIEPDAYAEYLRCFGDLSAIHAICEDYRASASIDLEHDAADIAVKIACPVMLLWGENGFVGQKYDVLATWRERAKNVCGRSLPCGHWLPEELPNETLTAIQRFLAA
jgi:haloacetate dehalogenase